MKKANRQIKACGIVNRTINRFPPTSQWHTTGQNQKQQRQGGGHAPDH